MTTRVTINVSGSGVPQGPRDSYPRLVGSPRPASNLMPAEADGFYADALRLLHASGIPALVAGTFAVNCYTGINRATKDLDVFCKAGDFPRILPHFKEHDVKSR